MHPPDPCGRARLDQRQQRGGARRREAARLGGADAAGEAVDGQEGQPKAVGALGEEQGTGERFQQRSKMWVWVSMEEQGKSFRLGPGKVAVTA